MLVLVVIIVVLLAVIAFLLTVRARGGSGTGAGGSTGGGTSSPGSQPTNGSQRIPDQIPAASLASYLGSRLVGVPLSQTAAAPLATPTSVIWVDQGDEILVHLDSISTQIASGCVLVSIDLETDQTGRTPLVVAFALGADTSGAMIASTDALPRGNGLLASRWGAQVQQAAWSALLSLAADHAAERGSSPLAISISNGQVQFHAGASPRLV